MRMRTSKKHHAHAIRAFREYLRIVPSIEQSSGGKPNGPEPASHTGPGPDCHTGLGPDCHTGLGPDCHTGLGPVGFYASNRSLLAKIYFILRGFKYCG